MNSLTYSQKDIASYNLHEQSQSRLCEEEAGAVWRFRSWDILPCFRSMCPQSKDTIRFEKPCPYFQCNRAITFPMDRRYHVTEATLTQEVAILVDVLKFDGLSVTANYLKGKSFDVFGWKLLYELLVCNLWLNGHNNKICFILGVRLILDLSCPDQMLWVGVNSEVNVLQSALNQASLRETAHRNWLLLVILKPFHHCSH